MFGRRSVSTGIDVGASSVKLVRREGTSAADSVTHVGLAEWTPQAGRDPVAQAIAALKELLERIGLGRSQLGTIAAAVGADHVSLREVTLPLLKEAELRRALPFEAKRYLFLEEIQSPVFDAQILGTTPAEAGENPMMRTLLAAADNSERHKLLKILNGMGLEPAVIDAAPLAGLNALLAHEPVSSDDRAAGLVDLGTTSVRLHITHPQGGLLTRRMEAISSGDVEAFTKKLADGLKSTLTYYRGRHRHEVGKIHLVGGGTLLDGLPKMLEDLMGSEVAVFDPLSRFAGSKNWAQIISGAGPRFVTAYGLSLRPDALHV